jgi:putative transcriptional regulator
MSGTVQPGSPAGEGKHESLRGRLLVASPRLADMNFERAVVVLLEHTSEGALGVVLNRPTDTPVGEILEVWQPVAAGAPPAVIFRGGPVAPNAVIGLVLIAEKNRHEGTGEDDDGALEGAAAGSGMPDTSLAEEVERWLSGCRPVVGNLATVDLSVPPQECEEELVAARLFSGYAGWAPGQLEGELEEGAWFVVDALDTDAMTNDPEDLWYAVLRRQKGPLAILRSYPPHPWVN